MKLIDILGSPWAITPDALDEITEIYSRHLRGDKIDIKAIEARIGQPLERREQGYEVHDGVAVIPVDGVISKKMNLFSQISGGASTQMIKRDLNEALADDGVSAIILHVDSPGGAVDGTMELAAEMYQARGRKPIATLADGQMASAALWIGSAADRVFAASETTIVGSIGIVTQHIDRSRAQKKAGIKVTDLFAGKYKVVGTQNEPLSGEGRDYIQARLDYLYTLFVDSVAEHRGVTASTVLENMADGKIFVGRQAINAGLVDGVSTLDQLIASLSSGEMPAAELASAGAAGEGVSLETAEQKTSEDKLQDTTMDIATLKKEHPDLAAALIDEGRQEGLEQGRKEGLEQGRQEGLEQGRKEGADAELNRVKAVRDASLPGHEKLVAGLMFDGETTGEQAMKAVLAAERSAQAARSSDEASDAADLAAVPASVEQEQANSDGDENLSLEDRAKKDWDGDKALRAEFAGNFDAYLAYAKNEGRAKVLGGKR